MYDGSAAEDAATAASSPARQSAAPSPPGSLLLGHVSQIESDPLAFLTTCQRDYGDIVRLRFFVWPAYLVSHPDHVKHVLQDRHTIYDKATIDWRLLKPALGDSLLTTDGDFWLRQRRLMQPAFHRQRIAAFAQIMIEETERMLERWRPAARAGDPIDVTAEMARLTMDVVTRALFGTEVDVEASSVASAVTELNREFIERGLTLRGLIAAFTGRPSRAARPAIATLDRIVGQIIARRRDDTAGRDDLLSMLIEARDEDTGQGMDDRQLRNEVLTLFVAGHETTSNALAWTWYLLSEHPAVRERLHEELAAVLSGRAPGVDDVGQLIYTRMVIDESMRLFPPAWATSRNAVEDDEIGGVAIRRGAMVMLSPYVTHRHRDFWPDPERFDPERFASDMVASRPRFAYFPFGGGPHLCIGSTFALTEATLVLATVAQRFNLELVPGHEILPEPMVTLRPRGTLPMTLRARDA